MVEADLQQQINEQLFDKLELAYVCVDRSMIVVDASNNLSNYGYGDVVIGANVEDCMDFMFGLDAQTQLDLPIVESPSGILVAVNLLPRKGLLTVLISNASVQAEQRQLLQQKANENELLVERQKKLMCQLEHASEQLEHKNQQLKEASRLQTGFLSGVSHEFRTPLTSIIGYTNLVEQSLQRSGLSCDDTDKKTNHLNAVQRSSKHLLSLVENLLDHGKLDSNEIVLRPKVIDLIDVFEDVELLLVPLSDAKNIELTFQLEFELGSTTTVVLDDSRLRQCLVNILGNAIKFTDAGSVLLKATLIDEVLRVTVTDTGLGISKSDLQKIRLPFWQGAETGKAGTGLGLTITERIIELMGGDLDISSELGDGTQVVFSLLAPIVISAPELEVSIPCIVPPSMSVLLAEDDLDIAGLIVLMMAERGVDVTHVENGALALQILESNQYDLILMDIHMPVMTGYDVLSTLQQNGNTTPVVIMSASAIEADRAKAETLGCFDYLIKPIDVDDVVNIINQAVS